MVFVPGEPVQRERGDRAAGAGRLFARNERVLCHFETAFGPMTVVLVGAIFVGSMETVWHGEVRRPPG
jgi:phosphatidylserine decarboxylase